MLQKPDMSAYYYLSRQVKQNGIVLSKCDKERRLHETYDHGFFHFYGLIRSSYSSDVTGLKRRIKCNSVRMSCEYIDWESIATSFEPLPNGAHILYLNAISFLPSLERILFLPEESESAQIIIYHSSIRSSDKASPYLHIIVEYIIDTQKLPTFCLG